MREGGGKWYQMVKGFMKYFISNFDELVESYVMPRYGTVTETILLS